MADAKLSDLTALAGANVASNDLLYVVDVSATTTGSKKITIAEFFAGVNTANGIDINPGSDIDADLITVGVTGSPKLWWDESENALSITHRLNIGDDPSTNSVDPMVNVNRAVTGDGAVLGNGHCFSDSSTVSRTGGVAYASYDCRIIVSGTAGYDHFAGFQDASTYGTSGTITNVYGVSVTPTLTAGAVTNRFGVYVANLINASAGNTTINYGVYVASLAGATKYSYYAAGNDRVFFGDMQLVPGGTASGDMVAGCQVRTASTNLAMFPSADQGTGDKVQICAYGNSALRSVFETANKASTALPDANLVVTGGNVGVGTSTHGASAKSAVTIKTGTAPTDSPADATQLYSADQAAGNACLHTRTENGAVIKLYQGAAVANPGAGEAEAKLIELLTILRAQGLIAT